MTEALVHQLLLSGALIGATTLIHGLFIGAGAFAFRAVFRRVGGPVRFLAESLALAGLSLWLMLAHSVEILLWAIVYLRLELFPALEPALYFAAVAYTTLGFGDVLLEEPWRLLAGAAAANGLLLFGLSAAFLVDATARLRLGETRAA